MTPVPRERPRWLSRILGALLVASILVPSSIGFGNKLREFIALYRGDSDGAFALSPVMNYLLAASGFFFLFCWAITQGMFRDLEQPKLDLLATEDRLEAEAAAAAIALRARSFSS